MNIDSWSSRESTKFIMVAVLGDVNVW
jgi:hypothetical protein